MENALVIGMGISGEAAVRFLLKKGYRVLAVDAKREKLKLPAHEQLEVSLDSGPIDVSRFSLVVPSPGISPKHPLYAEAKKKNIEIVGEAELALREMQQPCVAITGTNGKTTVTLLVEYLLKAQGIGSIAVGNIGTPLVDYLEKENGDEVLAVELSSYQLETMQTPIFQSGVLLNITPDHLDRYASMRDYAQAKCRLQRCMKRKVPFYVYEEVASEYGELLDPDYLTFGFNESCTLSTDCRAVKEKGKVIGHLPEAYAERGKHDSLNALAAWAIVREWGMPFEKFTEALAAFSKPPHRIEFVRKVDGVFYYDDSKGTNIDAVIQAVGSMSGPVLLIVGGVDKGASYAPWRAFKGKVKAFLAIGQAKEKIHRELSSTFTVEMLDDLPKAVLRAREMAKEGDSVLLSPGCSSFDMFRDYEERGDRFKQCVHHLEERRKKS